MTDYSQPFLATWGIYPKRNGKKVGKRKAFLQWQKLTEEDQRKAYADIRDRNHAGGWEFIKDMERYLKYAGWEDEWEGVKVTSDPDLVGQMSEVSVDDLCDHALATLHLCEHQTQWPWAYFGPQPGVVRGAVIPECRHCGRPQQRALTRDIAA